MPWTSFDPNGNLLTLNRNGATSAGGQNMDQLSYTYQANTNRLLRVQDSHGQLLPGVDLPSQPSGNYAFYADGNLKEDVSEGLSSIIWNASNKIDRLGFTPASGKPDLAFRYDAGGNRIAKVVKPDSDPTTWTWTYYVRDAQGNVLATYDLRGHNTANLPMPPGHNTESQGAWTGTVQALQVGEYHLYGSDRVGIYQARRFLKGDLGPGVFSFPPGYNPDAPAPWDPCGCEPEPGKDPCYCVETDECGCPPCGGEGCEECYCSEWPELPEEQAAHSPASFLRGRKRAVYPDLIIGKGKNHLGNVLVVVSDGACDIPFRNRKIQVPDGSLVKFYQADLHAYNDYYPYGMLQPGRNWQAEGYRYGFQGQESDDEVAGTGNAVSYKYRMQDARVGRFLSVDPLAAKYPFYSPYAFSGNRVMDAVELEGLEPDLVIGEAERMLGTPYMFGGKNVHPEMIGFINTPEGREYWEQNMRDTWLWQLATYHTSDRFEGRRTDIEQTLNFPEGALDLSDNEFAELYRMAHAEVGADLGIDFGNRELGLDCSGFVNIACRQQFSLWLILAGLGTF